MYLERTERRDPPKFIEQLTDITTFEGQNSYIILIFTY